MLWDGYSISGVFRAWRVVVLLCDYIALCDRHLQLFSGNLAFGVCFGTCIGL